MFKAKIDAIFKNSKEEYLILDWKTDKTEDGSSKHRRQLEAYKRAFFAKTKVPLDKINVAIAYIGLRHKINTGKIYSSFDDKKPIKTAFDTFNKKLDKFLLWRSDVNTFFNDLVELNMNDDALWRSVVEQYKLENG